jgi:hypothetical protein
MSRTLYEAVPVTPEVDVRLRRIESRIGRIEAALRERATVSITPAVVSAPATPAANKQWAEIGSRLEALALKLKLHYEQAGGDAAPRALDELRDRVEDAFTATGNAIRDDAVRADVREVGVMVGDAVADALTTVGGDMRAALHRAQVSKGGTP